MRLAWLIVVCSCSPPPPAGIRNTAPAGVGPRLEPMIVAPPLVTEGCELRWDELEAPARITLQAFDVHTDMDACVGFDPSSVFGACVEDCALGRMRGGVRAAVQPQGPSGSGHFWSVGIALDLPEHSFACVSASSVGFRLLSPVASMLAPLPWLEDVDRDGARELILWQRLPWGSSEIENGLYPVVYALDGKELVRRDDYAAPLRARVANAYRALARQQPTSPDLSCLRAIAVALEVK